MFAVASFGAYMAIIVLILEQRTIQLYRTADNRAAELEKLLGIKDGIRQIFVMPGQVKKFLGVPITYTASITMFYWGVALIWILAMIVSMYQIWI